MVLDMEVEYAEARSAVALALARAGARDGSVREETARQVDGAQP